MWYWIQLDHLILSVKCDTESPKKRVEKFDWKQGVILDHLTNRSRTEQGVILDHLSWAVTCDTRSPWVWYWITQKSSRIWLVVRCDTGSPNLGSNVSYSITLGVILDHPKEYWITQKSWKVWLEEGVILDHLTNRSLAEQGVILDHLLLETEKKAWVMPYLSSPGPYEGFHTWVSPLSGVWVIPYLSITISGWGLTAIVRPNVRISIWGVDQGEEEMKLRKKKERCRFNA